MNMFKYVLKRIALMFFVLFVILTMCFILVKLLPVTDAAQFGKDMNLILQRREALGYNKPLLEQLFIFFLSPVTNIHKVFFLRKASKGI